MRRLEDAFYDPDPLVRWGLIIACVLAALLTVAVVAFLAGA